MSDDEVREEIDKLVKEINICNRSYFCESKSSISDYDYDCLVNRLQYLEETYPHLKVSDSPSNFIGECHDSNFPKVPHSIPMLSLKKTYSYDDIQAFLNNVTKNIGTTDVTYFCELKLDGLSIEVEYIDKQLVCVSTRGDGRIGDNVTCNKELIKNLPNVLCGNDIPHEVRIRGEVLMTFEDFNNLNKELSKSNMTKLLNPRNAASGAIKTVKHDVNEPSRILTCFFYNVISDDVDLVTYESIFEKLKQWQVPVCRYYKHCVTMQDIYDFISYWETNHENLDFPIDGIVIKVNELKYHNILGNTNKNPRWAIAYKYKPDAVSTKLESVEYQVGRSGIITPVANLTPVNISGSIVKRVSLYNEKEIQRLNLHEGDYVLIKKSGEIIPKIIGIDITKHNPSVKPILFPMTCPSCDQKLDNRNGLWYCTNTLCPDQIIASITHFVSRGAMDIKSMGNNTIRVLVKFKLIKNIADIYDLDYDTLVNVPGFSNISVEKMVKEIEKSKNQSLGNVLFALGIPGVGKTAADNIVSKFHIIERIEQSTYDDLMTIPLIGSETAKNIVSFFKTAENIEMINRLKRHNVTALCSE